MLLSYQDVYGRKDTDNLAILSHRNDKNGRTCILFYRFANSVKQTAIVLFIILGTCWFFPQSFSIQNGRPSR